MDLHEALTQQLLTIVDTEFDHEIECQPAYQLRSAEFFLMAPHQLAPSMQPLLHVDLPVLAGRPAHASLHSHTLKRRADERMRLLGEFYQRACLCSVSAADEATWQGRRVVEMLRERCEQDALLIEALAANGEIVVAVPSGRQLECYALGGAAALRRLLWNNLTRVYSCLGMGHVDLPCSDEERMALSLVGQGLETLFFLFAERQVAVQVEGGTELFIHGIDSANVHAAIEVMHRYIGPRKH